jgi:hypothetical protein
MCLAAAAGLAPGEAEALDKLYVLPPVKTLQYELAAAAAAALVSDRARPW